MTQTLPFGDHPIEDASMDVLGRAPLAHALADELITVDVSRGLVAAITGPWGSGKTSLMNLTASRLRATDGLRVIEFNPWLFSGVDELAAIFLSELAAQLEDLEPRGGQARRVGAEVAQAISDYSGALSFARLIPGMGALQDGVKDSMGAAARALRGDVSLHARRDAAVQALSRLDGRVVVLVDDIDRLTPTEIRHLFRTVRLTASFPNVVYLLCLDRQVVESALSEDGFSGRAYLDKILTVTADVPNPHPEPFRRAFLLSLQQVVDSHETGPFNASHFGEVQRYLLDPLMLTVRDAKRVLASLPITLRLIRDELALADVIGLEALRTLAPELLALLGSCLHGLTTPAPSYGGASDRPELSGQITQFVEADTRGGSVARAAISTLFPAAERHLGGSQWASSEEARWRDERRVAASANLRFYLSRFLPDDIAAAGQISSVIDSIGDVASARDALARVPDAALEDVLTRLLPFTESAEPSVVPAAVGALIEQFPRLRVGRGRGFLDFGAEFAVTRPVLRLLRRLEADEVAGLSRRLIDTTPSLYGAFSLVLLVGHREGAGHRLATPEEATNLEAQLERRVRATPSEQLAGERDLVTMLFHTLLPAEDADSLCLPALADSAVAAAVLSDGVAETRSTPMAGHGSVQVAYSLHWDILRRLFGGEEAVYAAAEELRTTEGLQAQEPRLLLALELVDKYRRGWRPGEFGGLMDDRS